MPKLERVVRGPAGLGRRATAADFETGVGLEALGRGITGVGDATERIMHAELESKVSAAVQSAATRLNDLRLEEEANPDYDSSEERFSRARTEVLNEFREGIFSTRYKNLFDDRVFAISERTRLQVADNVRAKRLDVTRANAVTAHAKLVELAATADTDEMRETYLQQAEEALRGARASGAITETQAAKMRLGKDAALKDAADRRDAQSAADEILEKWPDDPKRQLAEARKFKGEKRDKVVARIKDRQAEAKAQRQEFEERRYAAATDAAWAGQLTRQQVIDMPLPAGETSALIGIIEKDEDGTLETNWPLYFDLRDALTNPGTRDKARGMDLKPYLAEIHPTEMKELYKLREAPDRDAIDTFDQKVRTALIQMRLPSTAAEMGKSQDGPARKAEAFKRWAEAQRRRIAGEKGHRLSPEDQDRILDAGREEIILDPGATIYYSRGRRGTLAVEDDIDVPEDQIEPARIALERVGIANPTADDIRDWYVRKLQRVRLP